MLESCQRLDEKHALSFLAGGLAPELRRSLEDHVDECEACRVTLAALIRGDKAAEWTPGYKVGRYVVGERLGRGAMGSVFRAKDLELGRAVALKRLHTNVNEHGRARLISEARVAAQLQHPNVVTVYEVGDADGVPFIAMELIEGTTLKAWLQAEPRSWRDVVDVLAQAGRGLAAAHARGLVHRDLKPDNILVDTSGRARVADFGLARIAQHADPGIAEVVGSGELAHTATGSLAGTPAYLAPEVVNGAQPDARSDQYAYGITLYEALHGQHPFAGKTAAAMWTEMAQGRIRDGGRSVPAWLARHVRRALAVDPADRWPGVAMLAAAIERRPRWPWPVAVAAGALVLAGISVAWVRSIETVDPCESGAQLVGTVWNPGIRDAQAARFLSVAPHRGGAVATAGSLLDDWAAAWRFGRSSACSAAPQQRERRINCLDRQLAELRAQLAVWTTADGPAVDHLVTASSALPRPDDCATHPPPPLTAPPALLDRISELNALWRAGRERVARSKLSAVLMDVEKSGDQGASASAHAVAGGIEIALGDYDRAREHAARAAQEAALAGDDETAIDAILLEAEGASARGRPLEALGLCEAADVIRIRNRLDSEDRIALVRGGALQSLGRFTEAIAALRRAVALLEPRAERDRRARMALASSLASLGTALGQADQLDEARRVLLRGLAIEETDLGHDHPHVGLTLHSLANREVSLGRLDDASAHFERARTIFIAAYGPTNELVCRTDIGLADLETARDHHDDARRYLMRAQAELADPPDDIVSGIEYRLGWADCEQHRADGIAHFDRAIAIFDRTKQTGENLARNLSARAKCLADLRRDTEARRDITRGLAELDAAHSDPLSYTETWDVLAEIEWRAGHKARAIELARRVVKTLSGQTFPEAVAAREADEAKLAQWTKSQ